MAILSRQATWICADLLGLRLLDPEDERAARLAEINQANAPWEAAERHLVDDIIDPAETRAVLADALRRARGPYNQTVMSKRYLANWPTGF